MEPQEAPTIGETIAAEHLRECGAALAELADDVLQKTLGRYPDMSRDEAEALVSAAFEIVGRGLRGER